MKAPALELPNMMRSFFLYAQDQQYTALGMLPQTLGSSKRSVTYFSKQIDEPGKGWLTCLRAVAVVVL